MFMAIRAEYAKVSICISIGVYHIERYRFQRRSPTTIAGCSSHSFGAVSNVLPDNERIYRSNISVIRPQNTHLATTCGGIDDTMVFWDGLLAESFITANERVLNETFTTKEVGRIKSALTQQSGDPQSPVLSSRVDADADSSSTGSSDDIGLLDAGEIRPRNIAVQLNEDLDELEEAVRQSYVRPVTGGKVISGLTKVEVSVNCLNAHITLVFSGCVVF